MSGRQLDPLAMEALNAMCSLHHRAFDAHILGVTPDYVIEVRPDVHRERQPPGRVADDVNGPLRKVLAGDDAVKVDDRALPLHRAAQANIVGVLRIRPAIPVQKSGGRHCTVSERGRQ